jgi:hypothetical protein
VKGLFLRLFLAFWLAMTLIGAALASMPALNMTDLRMERFRKLFTEAVRGAGERLVGCLEAGGAGCDDDAERLPDVRLSVYRDGELLYGGAIADGSLLSAVADGSDEERRRDDDRDHYAVAIERGGARYVGGGRGRARRAGCACWRRRRCRSGCWC